MITVTLSFLPLRLAAADDVTNPQVHDGRTFYILWHFWMRQIASARYVGDIQQRSRVVRPTPHHF